MVEAKKQGSSNFHANIVLSLSWMNNTNTSIFVLRSAQEPATFRTDQFCFCSISQESFNWLLFDARQPGRQCRVCDASRSRINSLHSPRVSRPPPLNRQIPQLQVISKESSSSSAPTPLHVGPRDLALEPPALVWNGEHLCNSVRNDRYPGFEGPSLVKCIAPPVACDLCTARHTGTRLDPSDGPVGGCVPGLSVMAGAPRIQVYVASKTARQPLPGIVPCDSRPCA